MLARIVELLTPSLGPGAVLVDATVGLGGHSAALLQAAPGVRLIGLDRDPQALAAAGRRLKDVAPASSFELVQAVFDQLPEVLADRDLDSVQAVLFDLGVSSLQLDVVARGFSYAHDAPLDMRMDPSGPRTAADIVNSYTGEELARVLFEFGEEKFARRIAAAILRERQIAPITGTARLAEIVRTAIPAATRRTGGHPAKRTFQALRIEVNGELDAVRSAIPAAVSAVSVGGRVAVLAYHSLEDRIVKRAFAEGLRSPLPDDLPVTAEQLGTPLRAVTRGAEAPGSDEISLNPRARSARLRVIERVAA
jgi:16S rRNA (cytosine1402-N4)-methyltransferase